MRSGLLQITTRSHDPRLRFLAAIELCKIAGVSQSGGLGQTAAADQKRGEQRRDFDGLLTDHMLNMSEIYGMPLPPGFAEKQKQRADKAAELRRQLGTEDAAVSKGRVRPSPSSSPK